MLNKKSVDDINVKGKKVLVRCDFNVPLKDGKITDENRLVAAQKTDRGRRKSNPLLSSGQTKGRTETGTLSGTGSSTSL